MDRSTDRPVRPGELAPEIKTAASVLAHDVPNFVRDSVELVKAEASAAAKRAAVRGGLLTTLTILSYIGLVLLSIGVAVLLSIVLDRPWAGLVIVGGAYILIGAIGIPIVLKRPKVVPQT